MHLPDQIFRLYLMVSGISRGITISDSKNPSATTVAVTHENEKRADSRQYVRRRQVYVVHPERTKDNEEQVYI